MGRSITDVLADAGDPFGFFQPRQIKKYNIEDYNTKTEAEQIRGMAKAWQDLIAARLGEMEDGSDVRETLQRRGLTDIALSQQAPPMVSDGDSRGSALFDAQRRAMTARAKVLSMSDEAGRNTANKARMAKTRLFRGVRDAAIGNTMSLAGALEQANQVNDMVSQIKSEGLWGAAGSLVGGALGFMQPGGGNPMGGLSEVTPSAGALARIAVPSYAGYNTPVAPMGVGDFSPVWGDVTWGAQRNV